MNINNGEHLVGKQPQIYSPFEPIQGPFVITLCEERIRSRSKALRMVKGEHTKEFIWRRGEASSNSRTIVTEWKQWWSKNVARDKRPNW